MRVYVDYVIVSHVIITRLTHTMTARINTIPLHGIMHKICMVSLVAKERHMLTKHLLNIKMWSPGYCSLVNQVVGQHPNIVGAD